MYPIDGSKAEYLVIGYHSEYDPVTLMPFINEDAAKSAYDGLAHHCDTRFLCKIIEEGN